TSCVRDKTCCAVCIVTTIIENLTTFFFSSRRRHTRLQGDWSSDVCSSDLRLPSATWPAGSRRWCNTQGPAGCPTPRDCSGSDRRSEERRVGKECRTKLLPYHITKK